MEAAEASSCGLEDENAKFKRMLADAMLDTVALKDLLGKKWRRPLPSAELPPFSWGITE